jgi:glutathione S-transferase
MLALSAKGTVPVLQVPADSGYPEAGQVIVESIDIMRWALQQQDPGHWLSEADAQASAELISRNDGEFKWALDRYKYADRYPERSAAEYRAMAEPFLQTLEQGLQQGAALLSPGYSLADAAIFPFIRQFALVDPVWFEASGYTALKQWLSDWLASELFASVMIKYPQWKAADPVTVFAPQAE